MVVVGELVEGGVEAEAVPPVRHLGQSLTTARGTEAPPAHQLRVVDRDGKWRVVVHRYGEAPGGMVWEAIITAPRVEPELADDVPPLCLGLVAGDEGGEADRGGGAQGPGGVLDRIASLGRLWLLACACLVKVCFKDVVVENDAAKTNTVSQEQMQWTRTFRGMGKRLTGTRGKPWMILTEGGTN